MLRVRNRRSHWASEIRTRQSSSSAHPTCSPLPQSKQRADTNRELIKPQKPRNPRENRIPAFPKPKKTPKLACCAGGKKSKTAEIAAKTRQLALAGDEPAARKSTRKEIADEPRIQWPNVQKRRFVDESALPAKTQDPTISEKCGVLPYDTTTNVEAAGIEPASRDISAQASTSVVGCLVFAAAALNRRSAATASGERF